MEHEEIEERQVVHRYLQGRLPPEEVERFEEHYLDCPECLADLEAAEGLHRGLRGVAAREAAVRAGLLAGALRLLRRRGAWLGAMAAVAALLAAGLLWRETERLETALQEARAPRTGSVIAYLSPVRSFGDSPPPRVHLPPDGGPVVLALDLAAREGALHRVTLRREDAAEPLWTGEAVPAGEAGEVVLSVPPALLAPGRYRVEAEPFADAAGATTVVFPFEVAPGTASEPTP